MRGVQGSAKRSLGMDGLCLAMQVERVPIDRLVHGTNWRDNVNYVRSFGYRDE